MLELAREKGWRNVYLDEYPNIYTSTGEQLAQLGGDGITAVPAVAQMHPSKDWVAAGTASGKLCLWM